MNEMYRSTVANIDLDNLLFNYEQFRKYLPKHVRIAPVVKADAYGHGAAECAKELRRAGVKTFCVAFVDEALALREAGIKEDILLLGYSQSAWAKEIIDQDLTPSVFTVQGAHDLHEEAVKQGKTGKIHIKIDTGMGRIGFAWQEAAEQIKKIYEMKNIFIEGIFTHYASADEKDKQFTLLQQERFESIVCTLNNAGIVIPVKHAANSAAAIDMEQQNMNMIRLGISLYGLYPSQEVQRQKIALKEVMQLRTKVAFVKNVEPGDSISYNRRFTATKPMRVATLPIGYADGYRREFTNNAYVMIAQQRANVLGTVCMDQIMVDVTHIADVKEGDDVILFGVGGISAEELAQRAGTIGYEILCGISKRIPRVYLKDGQAVGQRVMI